MQYFGTIDEFIITGFKYYKYINLIVIELIKVSIQE